MVGLRCGRLAGARIASGVGLNPLLEHLDVVLIGTGTGTNSKQVHKIARDHLTADFGTDEALSR